MSPARVESAVSAWGRLAQPLRLVAERENVVFQAVFTDGRRAALRLHRAGYQSPEGVGQELAWAEALATSKVPCPRGMRTQEGQFVVATATGTISAVEWAPGMPWRTRPTIVTDFLDLGQAIARLHTAADAIAIPLDHRPVWLRDGLVGESPVWGPFWENPALSAQEQAELRDRRAALAAFLDRLGAPDVGFIHADLLSDNILVVEDGMTLIDFDDAGLGYRLYDLGTALVGHVEHADFDEYAAALARSYSKKRGRNVTPDEILPFVVLRALASCGWAAGRLPPEDPRQRDYAARALRLSRKWCP